MTYYDSVTYNNYIFYLVLKNDNLFSCSTSKKTIYNAVLDVDKLKPYSSWLNKYFNGESKYHSLDLYLDYSSFTSKVLNQVSNIDFGQLKSYKDIADDLGNPNSSRAVGNALSKNNLLIFIPCHRVIRSDGSIGGYKDGSTLKKLLIDLEQKKS